MMGLYTQSFSELPDSTSEQASRLEDAAKAALKHGDTQGAVSSLRSAVDADPKFVRAWLTLGQYLLVLGQPGSAMNAFQKAIDAKPDEPSAYKIYAATLTANSRFADAIAVWQSYIRLFPNDLEALQNLAATLTQAARNKEASQILESAVASNPRNPDLQMQLARSYLRAGDEGKADTAYHNFLGLDPRSKLLDRAAYDLALADNTPLVAVEIAKAAVHALEGDSTDLDLDSFSLGDEDVVTRLASYWATLGYVYQRVGDSENAQTFLLASWKLSQNGVAAAHLCELYLAQHKTQSALQMCQFAHNRLPAAADPIIYHLGDLLQQNDSRLEKLSPGSSKTVNMKTIDQVVAMRDSKLPRVFSGTATAEFYVLLEYDPQMPFFRVIGAKRLRGSEKLESAGKALTNLKFNFVSPDGNQVRVLRRGTIVCGDSTGCEFMLADTTGGGSIPVNVVH